MILFIKNNKFILFLVFFAIFTHLQWFNLGSVLTFSDWSYWPNEATKQLWNSWGTWINYWNFGSVNIQISFLFFNFFWSIFTNIGFSYDFATKITFLIPVAILGFIAPYILSRKLIKNEFISFVVALFYGTTTYFLVRQTGHLPIAFVYALIPLTFYFFIKALDKNKFFNWLVFIFIYWISACYEIRITFISTLFLLFYFLFFLGFNIKKYWKNILVASIIFICLNSFWLIPTIFGGFYKAIAQVANRGIFGSFLFDINHSLTLFDDPWTGRLPNNQFVKQPIFWYFWFIPMIAFSSFLFDKSNRYKKEITFFGIVSLVGIFLTKQTDFPFVNAYEWIYKNIPGFNLFREASKFYSITALGYAGLLGYGLLSFKEHGNIIWNKYIYNASSIVIIFIAICNVKPLVTGEIGTMFVPRHIPQDYIFLKNFIINQPEYFRTLWFPTDSRWSIYTNTHPKVSTVNSIGSNWSGFIKNTGSDQQKIVQILKKPFSKQLLDNSSIKYIVIPLQDKANDDDFFVSYGKRELFINELKTVNYLHKVNIGTKELIIYENENFRPHIYKTQEKETIQKEISFQKVNFQFINPTEYAVSLKSISQPAYLNFSEAFHSNWKLRVGDFNWFKVLTEKNYFISDKYHFENDATLNSFYIDPAVFCKEYSCKKNQNGSYDIGVTIFFTPQSYMYLGLIISISTLVTCLTYLGYCLITSIRKRQSVHSI